MAIDHWPDTPTVLQGAYACDIAPDADGGAFGAWAGSGWGEEALFGLRMSHPGGHWQFAPGHDERDFMARLGVGRFRVYAGQLDGRDLNPIQLTESRTAIQDPAVAAFGDQRLVAWGERLDNRFVVRAWTGAEAETVAATPASLTRPAAAIDTDGQPWVAWQAFAGDTCVVVVSRRLAGGWTPPVVASVAGQSAWRPALRAAAGQGVWLAWDAWTGHHFHVFARRIGADGALGPVIQVSDLPLLAMDADIAVDADDTAWVTWEQSPAWGDDHRFNRSRHLTLAAVDASGETFLAGSPWGAGQAPIPIESFMQSICAEYIVPVSPRLVAGRDGIELFFQRFRSRHQKDFGWGLERMVYSGSSWSEPETVSPFPGDAGHALRRGGAGGRAAGGGAQRHRVHPHADGRASGGRTAEAAGRQRARGSRAHRSPDARAVPPPAAEPPLRVEFARYEGSRVDNPQARRDGRTLTVGDQTYHLYWGDMHRHSHLSKCMSPNDGTPVQHFRWAVDHNRMDWWALTEHLEYLSYNEWRGSRKPWRPSPATAASSRFSGSSGGTTPATPTSSTATNSWARNYGR